MRRSQHPSLFKTAKMTKYEETLDRLNRCDLVEVAKGMNLTWDHSDNTRAHFLCPFHNDHTPSFTISLSVPDGYQYQAYMCHVCGAKGAGAVRLVQELLKQDGQVHEHLQLEAMRKVAEICGVKDLQWNFKNEQHHEEFVDSDYCDTHDRYARHYSSVRREGFTDYELRALGVDMLIDERGWTRQRIADMLHQQFSCWALTDCRYSDENGRLHHNWSTEDYPMFEFDYGNYIRKYEPYYGQATSQQDKSTRNYKNAYFALVGEKVNASAVYGDADLLRVLMPDGETSGTVAIQGTKAGGGNGEVVAAVSDAATAAIATVPSGSPLGAIDGYDESTPAFPSLAACGKQWGRGVVEAKRLMPDPEKDGSMKRTNVKLLKSIVICSGQKDAINVYMHTDAHVLYPHSETSNKGLSRQLINRCLLLADKVFVCFDADEAGQREQNRLCLRHLELRPIHLPNDLRSLSNGRGKMCKDVTEFLTIYCPRHDMQPSFQLAQIMRQSKDLKFWKTHIQRKRTEEKGEYDYESKYEFDPRSMARFLSANGFRGIWRENSDGVADVMGYMHIGPYHTQNDELLPVLLPNQVKIIQLSNGYDYAVRIIQNFFRQYNLTDDEAEYLESALVTQRKVSESAFRLSVQHALLDIHYWMPTPQRDVEKGVHWLFLANKAMRISKDDISLVDYRDVPFMVNQGAVSEWSVMPMTERLQRQIPRFELNPEYKDAKVAYDTKMDMRTCSPEQRRQMTKQFTDYERLWRMVRVDDGYDKRDRHPIFRIEENTCRLYWEKEENGYQLTADEKQMQDILLYNRMNNIGFMLIPYRTKANPQFILFMDYKAMSKNTIAGGTGKSTIFDFMNCIVPVYKIKGQIMKTGVEYSRNFDGFIDGMHRVVAHDDLNERFRGSEMNGLEDGIDVKSLYKDTVRIPFDVSPKMMFSTNHMNFDVNDPSTARRMGVCPVSDYYHPEDTNGTKRIRNYMTDFGHDPVKDATLEEQNAVIWYFAHCIQTNLREGGNILSIPSDENMRSRYTSASINDGEFIMWAQSFFQQECHFCRPIAISEMQLSFARWVNGDSDLNTTKVRAGRTVFMENIEKYIRTSGIQRLGLENAAIRGRANGTAKYPDRNCWVTQEQNGYYHPELPRTIRQSDCCYFYRESDKIPIHSREVLGCGDSDPEIEVETT